MGDRLVIEAVEQITLVVSKPGSDLAQTEADWQNGIDSPDGQPDREDPQVVADREEALTALPRQSA